MWRKRIVFLATIIVIASYFFQLGRVARNYSQSYRFGDEDAHLAGGYLLLKGYKMYQDFAGNHQPLTYFFPAAVQTLTRPDSLYQLIGRHREAIYGYSVAWNILYLLVFGPLVFFFTAIFEIMRYVMLGNKVLAEPLATYPLIFLFGIVIKKIIFNKTLRLREIILFSLSSFIAAFSLLPIWPTIVILNICLLAANRKKRVLLFWQTAVLLIPVLLLFIIVPFREYFQQTFIDNYAYVIPKMNLDKIAFPGDYIRMIFLPFTGFHNRPNFIETAAVLFLFLYAAIFYLAARMKKIWPFLLIFAALILANNRTFALKYGNFHILPWLGVYFFIPIVFLTFYKKSSRLIIISSYILLAIIALGLNLFGWTDYYGYLMSNLKNNLAAEHNINYNDSNKYGLAIKAIKAPGDRLLALPNDTLVFWVAGIDPATRPLESYDWQYDIPRYRQEIIDVFTTHPPEFYLYNTVDSLQKSNPIHLLILQTLASRYVRLNHQGKPSGLYILKTKIPPDGGKLDIIK